MSRELGPGLKKDICKRWALNAQLTVNRLVAAIDTAFYRTLGIPIEALLSAFKPSSSVTLASHPEKLNSLRDLSCTEYE